MDFREEKRSKNYVENVDLDKNLACKVIARKPAPRGIDLWSWFLQYRKQDVMRIVNLLESLDKFTTIKFLL